MTYYDKIAEGYDDLHKEEQLKKLRIIKDNLEVKATDKLLDVGAGSGISSDFNCKVYCLDPSEELLKQIKDKITITGNAEHMPFEDKEFDIVISVTAIHNFNGIEKGLKEMKRVGKDKFVFSILKKSDKKDLIEKLIKDNFEIDKMIEEEKDIIYFCKSL